MNETSNQKSDSFDFNLTFLGGQLDDTHIEVEFGTMTSKAKTFQFEDRVYFIPIIINNNRDWYNDESTLFGFPIGTYEEMKLFNKPNATFIHEDYEFDINLSQLSGLNAIRFNGQWLLVLRLSDCKTTILKKPKIEPVRASSLMPDLKEEFNLIYVGDKIWPLQ